jgi:hypothetical protein
VQAARCRAGDHERRDRADEAREHRDELHARKGTEHGAHDDEHQEPERARRRLDALAGVEDGPVPGEDLVDDAQVDERVFVHPAVLPAADRDHERRQVRGRRTEQAPAPPYATGGPGAVRLVGAVVLDERRHRFPPSVCVRM